MISIVMSYFNRLTQLRYTLKTIGQSQIKDVEILFCGKITKIYYLKKGKFLISD